MQNANLGDFVAVSSALAATGATVSYFAATRYQVTPKTSWVVCGTVQGAVIILAIEMFDRLLSTIKKERDFVRNAAAVFLGSAVTSLLTYAACNATGYTVTLAAAVSLTAANVAISLSAGIVVLAQLMPLLMKGRG